VVILGITMKGIEIHEVLQTTRITKVQLLSVNYLNKGD
jgi:hypothetical protein